MYAYGSKEHSLLGGYYRANEGVILHENKLAYEPERSVLLANGHIEKLSHPTGGFGYRITQTGKSEFASILPPQPLLPGPADLELQKGIELKKKLRGGTITAAEKVELNDIVLKRVSL